MRAVRPPGRGGPMRSPSSSAGKARRRKRPPFGAPPQGQSPSGTPPHPWGFLGTAVLWPPIARAQSLPAPRAKLVGDPTSPLGLFWTTCARQAVAPAVLQPPSCQQHHGRPQRVAPTKTPIVLRLVGEGRLWRVPRAEPGITLSCASRTPSRRRSGATPVPGEQRGQGAGVNRAISPK